MRNRFRVMYRPSDGRYTLQRKSWFGWWRFVSREGKPYHYEHFSHGNDYDVFCSRAGAEDCAKSIVRYELETVGRVTSKHKWMVSTWARRTVRLD